MNADSNADRPRRRMRAALHSARPFLVLVVVLLVLAEVLRLLHTSLLVRELVPLGVAAAVTVYWRLTNRDGWLTLAAVTAVVGVGDLPIGAWTLLLQALVVLAVYLYTRRQRSQGTPSPAAATGTTGGGDN